MVLAISLDSMAREKVRRKAYDDYQQALGWLKMEPTSPQLRGEALSLGRAYAALTRSQGKVALFDEVALMNDIDAACAAASVRPQSSSQRESVEARLAKLSDLRSRGLIDDAEYAEARREILRDV